MGCSGGVPIRLVFCGRAGGSHCRSRQPTWLKAQQSQAWRSRHARLRQTPSEARTGGLGKSVWRPARGPSGPRNRVPLFIQGEHLVNFSLRSTCPGSVFLRLRADLTGALESRTRKQCRVPCTSKSPAASTNSNLESVYQIETILPLTSLHKRFPLQSNSSSKGRFPFF